MHSEIGFSLDARTTAKHITVQQPDGKDHLPRCQGHIVIIRTRQVGTSVKANEIA